MNFSKKTFFILLFLVAWSNVWLSEASVISISSPKASFGNETVSISIDTQGKSINAIEVHLGFNPDEFQVQNVSDGGSIVSMWIQKPAFSNGAGTLDFSGIIPGGYDGANGKIIAVSIVPKETDALGGFRVVSSNVLLNDGKGTPDRTTTENSGFTIERLNTSVSPSQRDTQPPDPFTPEIGRDPSIFNDKYFLVFSTTDQLSGIDHYEVRETPTGFGHWNVTPWQTAESPYLLNDQALSSDISVRAVDKTGNFRIVNIPARFPSPISPSLKILLSFIVILLIGIFFFKWKKKKATEV